MTSSLSYSLSKTQILLASSESAHNQLDFYTDWVQVTLPVGTKIVKLHVAKGKMKEKQVARDKKCAHAGKRGKHRGYIVLLAWKGGGTLNCSLLPFTDA